MKVPNVKTNISIEPLKSVFEVNVEGPSILDRESFVFSITSDGDVVINDNVFSSKAEAAKVLKAMSEFLSKK